jgi:hypothetical protein
MMMMMMMTSKMTNTIDVLTRPFEPRGKESSPPGGLPIPPDKGAPRPDEPAQPPFRRLTPLRVCRSQEVSVTQTETGGTNPYQRCPRLQAMTKGFGRHTVS